MNITQALKIIRGASHNAKPFEVTLACGFTPLHLETFLAAHLQQVLPDRRVKISSGLYGNLANTVEAAAEGPTPNLVIALEWADLDPRLGYRASCVWQADTLTGVLSFAGRAVERIGLLIERLPKGTKIALSLPTLPLPPIFHTAGWQLSESESLLGQVVAEFKTKMVRAGVSIANEARLAAESPLAMRYDPKSDLLLGLPYSVGHADALAASLARLLCPPPSLKGLITDLDDTLWAGLVGEVGPDRVHWDLDHHSGFHALYQSFLASLSESGVLIGVASKNDLAVVQSVFERPDILLRAERIFPMEVHWNAKSNSVERILQAWNIDANAVAFVDDSPIELAEVAAAHPGIQCIEFPGKDYSAGHAMLQRLRDLFGKQKLSSEDSIRLTSVRQLANFNELSGGSVSEGFLQELHSVIHFDHGGTAEDSRALELVNKTNQFNLNGIRYTESDWAVHLSQSNARLIVVSYEDRFGRLGKIAVILGRLDGDIFHAPVWVMSCRAFGRRIEYAFLRMLFERYGLREVRFDFARTKKNGPLQAFFGELLGDVRDGEIVLTRERFQEICPALYYKISETRSLEKDGRDSQQTVKVF